MDITCERDGAKLVVAVSGRVDTTTAPEFDKYITEHTDGVEELILDLKNMTYTSSAGLRVFLKTQKLMNEKGTLKLINVQPEVMDVFEITGFTDILTFE